MRLTIIASILSTALFACASPSSAPDDGTPDPVGDGKVDGGAPDEECDGATVPGDYADLQSAINVMTETGIDGTICLQAGTFEAMAFPPLFTFEIIASRVAGNTTFGIGAEEGTLDLTIDRSELGPADDRRVFDVRSLQSQLSGRITNSIVRMPLEVFSTYASSATFDVVNNTFIGGSLAISTSGSVANNIFTGSPGAALSITSDSATAQSHNAFWDNASNYQGAVPSATNIKKDCLLTSTGKLGAGSPCIDAADGSLAPDHDYMNNERDSQPDIGAFERQ
ncbi:hypothetical protein BH11MYX2_BH11MYX2_08090 [soil metagenome]